MQRSARFSGRLTTLLTMMGVAIGLGNVWRFPYMMGQYGGSAFLLLYLALTLFFATPLLAAEWALGRHTRRGPFGTYKTAFGPRGGTILAAIVVFGVLVADSYYMVVIGNILYTSLRSIGYGFSGTAMSTYQQGLANGHLQYALALTILALGSWITARGVRQGIEAVSRWFVPFFGIVVLYLVYYALTLPGASAHFREFLAPDFSAIGVPELFAALGQAFFSLGVGGTFMVVYGNYLKDDAMLPGAAVATALGDSGAALLASLFIVPTILVFGLDMASGPRLIFNTLPTLFATMPAGRLVGSLMLVALLLMAFLSAVAALEVCASGVRDLGKGRVNRLGAAVIVAVLEAILMWPSAHSPDLIGILDLVFGSGMQIFGAGVAVIALTWFLGRRVSLEQIFTGHPPFYARWFYLWLKWVIPAALSVILGLYIYHSIHG